MTSLLQPGYSLTLGSQRWTEQLLRMHLTLAAAPLLDSLSVDLPSAAPMSAGVGDPVDLTLNSGEHESQVFSGTIDAIRHSLDSIRVTAFDAGGVMAQFRPAVTYEKITTGNVVRSLCDEAGVDTGDIEDGGELVYYAADSSRSALDHIARVCAWSGATVRVSADNRIESLVINATQAESALKYGREVLTIETRRISAPVGSFTVAGESGAGSTSAPEALRPSTDFFGGSRPAGPSRQARWRSEPALRTAKGAGTAGAALQRSYGSGRQRGSFEAFLQPALRPGAIIEIQDLPAGLPSGPLWISRVRHSIGPGGALTRAHFCKGGDSFDPRGLLGSLLGAVGGLL